LDGGAEHICSPLKIIPYRLTTFFGAIGAKGAGLPFFGSPSASLSEPDFWFVDFLSRYA
jgi:hypothetical protein